MSKGQKKVGDMATISISNYIMVQGKVAALHSGGVVELNQTHPLRPGEMARGIPN